MFVDANAARAAARRAIDAGPTRSDPAFANWAGGIPGEPLTVCDEAGERSYWLVPVRNGQTTVGAVRVLGSGRVAASIAYRAGSDITALSEAGVLERARATLAPGTGERTGDAMLVHDGPPGREAWRVEVLQHGKVVRWIFVTPAGTYQREAPGG